METAKRKGVNSTPFYMRTKFQNRPMLPVKEVISSYVYKPQSNIPSAAELDTIFKSIYRGSCKSSKKPPKINLRPARHTPKAMNLSVFSGTENMLELRRKRYQQLFCSSRVNNSDWNSLVQITGANPDGTPKFVQKVRCPSNKLIDLMNKTYAFNLPRKNSETKVNVVQKEGLEKIETYATKRKQGETKSSQAKSNAKFIRHCVNLSSKFTK